MLSKKFQQKVYNAYKEDHNKMVAHGQYCYGIAYNATASIHTWIIRRKRGGLWYWFQPLDIDIK